MSNNKKVSVKSYLLKTYKENRKSLNKIMAIALFGALITSIIPYIYGGVSLFIIVLLYIAYACWRIKRMIKKEIQSNELED